MENTKDIKTKFTTTLSNECIKGFKILRGHYGVKYDNHLIEFLVQKEIKEIINREMDKQKD